MDNSTDDQNGNLDLTLRRCQAALKRKDLAHAVSILLDLHPADRAEVFNKLDDDEQDLIIIQLDIPTTADLLEELEDRDVLEAIEPLPTDRLADVLDEMDKERVVKSPLKRKPMARAKRPRKVDFGESEGGNI